MLTNRPYLGTEAEGPHKNKELLFVPGCVSLEDFEKAWSKVRDKVAGIYYGAGGYRGLKEDVLQRIEEQPCDVKVTEFLDGETIYVLDMHEGRLYRKIEHPYFVIWIDQGSTKKKLHFTWLGDYKFENDKEVE